MLRTDSALSVRPFAAVRPRLLRPRLTSAPPIGPPRRSLAVKAPSPRDSHVARCGARAALALRAESQISQGKARGFRPTYPPHVPPAGPNDYRASGLRAPSPTGQRPQMRFVYLGPGLRLQLPSDPASRRTPLLFGSEFRSSRSPGDSHPQATSRFGLPPRLQPTRLRQSCRFAPCLAHTNEPPPRSGGGESQAAGRARRGARAVYSTVKLVSSTGIGTSSVTGTTTRSVPLPGPGSGSSLATHRVAW